MWLSLLILPVLVTAVISTNPCGSGWSYYDGSCYKMIRSGQTHQGAINYCKKYPNGGLADIKNARQNSFITNHVMKKSGSSGDIHIALKDFYGDRNKRRTWATADNDFPWLFHPQEPNNVDTERCVHTGFNGEYWNNNKCITALPYICEKVADSSCESGWTLYNKHCYFFSNNDHKNWYNSRIFCQQNGAILVKVETTAENKWLYGKIGRTWTWIGLNSMGKPGYFRWADDDQLYLNWETGRGGLEVNSGCVMANKHGRWRQYACNKYIGTFICEHPLIDRKCSCNRILYKDKCYHFVNKKKTFSDANKYCESAIQGNVMQITSPKLMELAQALRAKDDYWMWIGVVDYVIQGYFQTYPAQSVTYTNWDSGEPNNSGGSERCAELEVDGKWNDISCSTYKWFVCERKIGHSLYIM